MKKKLLIVLTLGMLLGQNMDVTATEQVTNLSEDSYTNIEVLQAEVVGSGKCGENLTWELDSQGILKISGTGTMDKSYPWKAYKDSLKLLVLQEGSMFPLLSAVEYDNYAFEGCSNLTGDILIPDSVTTIEDHAFMDCSGFQGRLIIPQGVTNIGNHAFYRCAGLSGELSLPQKLQELGNNAFAYCSSLTGDLEIPDTITTIGNGVFSVCTSFDGKLIIPEGILSIGQYAFSECGGLQGDLRIPKSVKSIGKSAFAGCAGFDGRLVLQEGLLQIGEYAFSKCSGFTGVLTFPDTLISIDNHAFMDCTGFTGDLVIPEGITSVENHCFYNCNGLNGKLVLPKSLTVIEDYAFSKCSNLTGQLSFPEYMKKIGGSAFNECKSLVGELTLPKGITTINNYAFARCSGFSGDLVMSEDITTIGKSAFAGCNGFEGMLVIPKSVMAIDESAFFKCSGFTKVINNSYVKCTLPQVENYQWFRTDKKSERIKTITNGSAKRVQNVVSVFEDLKATDWWHGAVQFTYAYDIMAGAGEKFYPAGLISREEFVQVLYNSNGKPEVTLSNPYTDVKNTWYKNAVLWAKVNNIANGKGNGKFGVGESISRQDLALMLYKYAQLKNYNLDTTSGLINLYADGHKVSNYARNAMDWAVTQGILSGKGKKGEDISTYRLDPIGTATRAECASMMMKLMTKN